MFTYTFVARNEARKVSHTHSIMSANFDISIPFHYFSLPSKPLLGISNCLLDLYRDLMKEKGIPDLTPDYYLKAMEMYRYTYLRILTVDFFNSLPFNLSLSIWLVKLAGKTIWILLAKSEAAVHEGLIVFLLLPFINNQLSKGGLT